MKPAKILLLLDYDGTLTPIVRRPEEAVLSRPRRKLLVKLARRPGIKLAVVSGRKLSEVKKLIGIPRLIYVGNHGFEIGLPGRRIVFPAARKTLPLLKKIKAQLNEGLKIKGVLIEDKELTLSVHYRLLPKAKLTSFKRIFNRVLHPWKGKIKITSGKKVFEIRPPFDWDKGKAVKWIINRLKLQDYLPIYFGDDRTDEDAFRALRRKGITVLVGSKKPTLAVFRLPGPNQVYTFFNFLLREGI